MLITPITDRTEEDTIYAFNNSESTEDLKGALNSSDLNRIEDNFKYICERLKEYAIYIDQEPRNFKEEWYENQTLVTTVYNNWTDFNVLYKTEMDRIRRNYNRLIAAILSNTDIKLLEFKNTIKYDEINTIEKIPLLIDSILDKMNEYKIYCGIPYCGEVYL